MTVAKHVFAPLDPDWRERAACRGVDTELFYADLGSNLAKAKGVCDVCPVREDCLEYALGTQESEGLWGGMTTQERRKERRKRLKASLPERKLAI